MPKRILDEAKEIAQKVAINYKPKKIILFGSVARGQATSQSDIDLLVIADSQEKRPFRIKRIFEAVRGISRFFPLDPIVYTQEEIDKRLFLGDPFVTKVINQGTVLYG